MIFGAFMPSGDMIHEDLRPDQRTVEITIVGPLRITSMPDKIYLLAPGVVEANTDGNPVTISAPAEPLTRASGTHVTATGRGAVAAMEIHGDVDTGGAEVTIGGSVPVAETILAVPPGTTVRVTGDYPVVVAFAATRDGVSVEKTT
jgi:hypothetical protein